MWEVSILILVLNQELEFRISLKYWHQVSVVDKHRVEIIEFQELNSTKVKKVVAVNSRGGLKVDGFTEFNPDMNV